MEQRLGYIYGIAAYLCWGAFPLYFALLADIDPYEAVPWRVLTALVFCVLAVTVMRAWSPVFEILRSARMFGWFILASLLLYANWQIFVVGVVTERILETALGYFINPLVTILIGVIVRKERLTRLQWIAVGIAGIGVIISAIAYGQFPLIALSLAFTFGFYGAVRKQTSQHVDALTGLTVETMIASAIAIPQLIVILLLAGRLGAFEHGPAITTLLLLSGVVTAIPLLLFAAGNRRLPLSHMGFIQFTTPILAFLTGYFIFHEEMPLARWIGFAAVWVALIVLLVDMVLSIRRVRRTPAGAEPPLTTGEIATHPVL
ncbi:EamA family transporter RarD [Leucobacter soli]|uniref:Protein RarD n=1 Tax=Leucobacter soli TaxID=2812850 RepID=A0A916JSD6_9MICO|nr:EamA family transporter RarD [Leucobacter soli]CAG7599653.1 Protein RarD [Leucobacter soli]